MCVCIGGREGDGTMAHVTDEKSGKCTQEWNPFQGCPSREGEMDLKEMSESEVEGIYKACGNLVLQKRKQVQRDYAPFLRLPK